MKAEFINPFLTSLLDVLGTMARIELRPGKPALKQDDRARGDISGVIGMVGPQIKGSFAITFDESLALAIYANMLGERAEQIDDQVGDMVGEITNMVTGGAKRLLGEEGFDFEMATPVVVTGAGHTIRHQVEGPRLSMPFDSDAGRACLEICFEE